MSSGFTYVVVYVRIAFLVGLNNTPFYVYTPYVVYLCISSGHLGHFHLWAVVNDAAMDMGARISVRDSCFQCFCVYS